MVLVLLLWIHFCLYKVVFKPATVTFNESPPQMVLVPLGVVLAFGGEEYVTMFSVTVLDLPYALVAVNRIVCLPAVSTSVGF